MVHKDLTAREPVPPRQAMTEDDSLDHLLQLFRQKVRSDALRDARSLADAIQQLAYMGIMSAGHGDTASIFRAIGKKAKQLQAIAQPMPPQPHEVSDE